MDLASLSHPVLMPEPPPPAGARPCSWPRLDLCLTWVKGQSPEQLWNSFLRGETDKQESKIVPAQLSAVWAREELGYGGLERFQGSDGLRIAPPTAGWGERRTWTWKEQRGHEDAALGLIQQQWQIIKPWLSVRTLGDTINREAEVHSFPAERRNAGRAAIDGRKAGR